MPSAVLEKPSSCQEGKHTSYSQNILYIDAYDSFSYNVVAMLEEALGAQVTVLTIDSEWPNGDMNGFLRQFEAVVLGPGPGHPATPGDVGIMKDLWTLSDDNMVPVLGICLGFQSLCFHHGIPIEQLPYPLHGQVRYITPVDGDVFRGLPDFEVTLYHSLYAVTDGSRDNLGQKERNGRSNGKAPSPDDLSFLAWLSLEEERCSTSSMQVAMAVRHREKPFWGFQFHPESCKSDRDVCTRLLKNWWSESLQFNKRARRVIFPGSLKQAMRSRGLSYSPPNIMSYMLQWSASTSEHAVSRFVPLGGLTTETICEALNEPGSPTVLFQSNGRYSIISVPSPGSWRLEFYVPIKRLFLQKLRHGNDSQTTESDGHHEKDDTDTVQVSLGVSDFWNVLRYLMKTKKVSGGCDEIPFWGGLLGYFSYEMGIAGLAHSNSQFCQTPEGQSIGDDLPDVSLLWVERSVVVDNGTGRAYIQSTVRDDEDWIHSTRHKLEQLSSTSQRDNTLELEELLNPFLENVEIILPHETSYKEQVQSCQVQLEAGESYELCLTCETPVILEGNKDKKDCDLRPWLLYRKLRKYNPAAFSAYARLGNVKIASSSPECFLNWDRKSMLEMKPMKGTVKKTPDVDLEKAKEMLGSTKEMAENLMIADLIRHDLYGICGSSRVFVEKLLEVEDHGRVYQMITHVKGEIDHQNPGHGVRSISQLHEQDSNMSTYGITALQRCLPPGSMTGAPKERSCMHLSSIERRKRGIYSGVMGYLDLGGGGSFSVLIRTAFSCSADDDDKQIWRVGAGGAVTTLSTAEGEWNEMITKLRTVLNVFTPSNKVRR